MSYNYSKRDYLSVVTRINLRCIAKITLPAFTHHQALSGSSIIKTSVFVTNTYLDTWKNHFLFCQSEKLFDCVVKVVPILKLNYLLAAPLNQINWYFKETIETAIKAKNLTNRICRLNLFYRMILSSENFWLITFSLNWHLIKVHWCILVVSRIGSGLVYLFMCARPVIKYMMLRVVCLKPNAW